MRPFGFVALLVHHSHKEKTQLHGIIGQSDKEKFYTLNNRYFNGYGGGIDTVNGTAINFG